MNRTLLENLKQWKNKRDRLPLILKGARQVGKSWLLQEFGRTCFKDVLYINFENADDVTDIFEGKISPRRIIDYLGALHGRAVIPEKTLIIFDEVQEVPRALTSLKYFAEEAPEYAVCCAGSLLGVALHEGTSFPVGKTEFMTLQPMSFYEFLLANEKEKLAEYVVQHSFEKIPEGMMNDFNDLLKQYLVIGGMPQAVKTWLETHDFSAVCSVQAQIIEAYKNDFSKHAPSRLVPRLRYLWQSIPSQLAKENKKFVYGLVREGARAREYEEALLWLQDAGAVRRLGLTKKGIPPLKAYEDLRSFKLYLLDVGLLSCLSGTDPAAIISKTGIFKEFSGALTEQFVFQELECLLEKGIYYWSSGATAEVDFVFERKGQVIPVEAKAGITVHAKSLSEFKKKYAPVIAVKTSLRNIDYTDNVLNLPLALLWNMLQYLDEGMEQLKAGHIR